MNMPDTALYPNAPHRPLFDIDKELKKAMQYYQAGELTRLKRFAGRYWKFIRIIQNRCIYQALSLTSPAETRPLFI